MSYYNAVINQSPTICGTLGADVPAGKHKAVQYAADGTLLLATNGENAVGVLLSTTDDDAKKGDEVTFLIRDIGLMETGGAVAIGDLVTVDENGRAIKATTGSAVFGRAFSTAEGADYTIGVNIIASGATMGTTTEKGE